MTEIVTWNAARRKFYKSCTMEENERYRKCLINAEMISTTKNYVLPNTSCHGFQNKLSWYSDFLLVIFLPIDTSQSIPICRSLSFHCWSSNFYYSLSLRSTNAVFWFFVGAARHWRDSDIKCHLHHIPQTVADSQAVVHELMTLMYMSLYDCLNANV